MSVITSTVLRKLLAERHCESHGEFLREYDRVARLVAPHLVGKGPAKTVYYRWLRGQLVTQPRGYHCRILEGMFPGWTIQELMAPTANIIQPLHRVVGPTIAEPSTPEPERQMKATWIGPYPDYSRR